MSINRTFPEHQGMTTAELRGRLLRLRPLDSLDAGLERAALCVELASRPFDGWRPARRESDRKSGT